MYTFCYQIKKSEKHLLFKNVWGLFIVNSIDCQQIIRILIFPKKICQRAL